ncbi:MAG: translation elongation factor Ts [Ardenticatenaceae bacterium]
MAKIPIALVKELRERTGAGILNSKKALQETNGDIEKAIKLLRERGIAKAAKRASREAKEGLVESYIHLGGRIGVLVEVNCETDFVARNEAFKELAHEIALHIAAANPRYIKREEISQEDIEKERQIYINGAIKDGKPEKIAARIAEGRINKFFYKEQVLMEQPFVKTPDKTIETLIKEHIAKLGENIVVGQFVRYQIGD